MSLIDIIFAHHALSQKFKTKDNSFYTKSLFVKEPSKGTMAPIIVDSLDPE